MRFPAVVLTSLIFATLVACKPQSIADAPTPAPTPEPVMTLDQARHGFVTHLTKEKRTNEPAPEPPAKIFRLVTYPSAGPLPAYVGIDPKDGAKHPAIIWIVGGFSNSISEVAWEPGTPDNDQSASAFREAGIVMMYPGLRGGNDSRQSKEGFYGEVDDVLAAANYLSKVDYVDPQRIYLGGHSTGGTLALLAAESASHFRAVFSFGPVEDVRGYGEELLPFDLKVRREWELRAPGRFLQAIHAPTFVFEGASGRSNIDSLRAMAKSPHPPSVHFYPVPGADHFATLQPLTRLIAQKILADHEAEPNINFTMQEIAAAVKKSEGAAK